MDTAEQARVIEALAKVAREPILRRFRRDSCIASTRIGMDVLHYFGITSAPRALTLVIFNESALDMLNDGKTLEQVVEAAHARGMDEEGGPWSVGIGAGDLGGGNSTGWAGHLMINVGNRVLIDLSIDQGSRPHKDIVLTIPAIFMIPQRSWWSREDRSVTQVLKDDGDNAIAIVFDNHPPDPNGYKRTENWRRVARGERWPFTETTAEIIRLMKQELA